MYTMAASKWIKFSNRVVNTAHISHIDISPERISLHINNALHQGSGWGSTFFGFFSFKPVNYEVYVDRKDNEVAFQMVKEWIDRLPE